MRRHRAAECGSPRRCHTKCGPGSGAGETPPRAVEGEARRAAPKTGRRVLGGRNALLPRDPAPPLRPPLRGAETHVRTEPARGAGHRRGPARSRSALRPARSPRSTRQRHCPGLGGRELRSRAHTWRKRLSDESQQGGVACRVIPPE